MYSSRRLLILYGLLSAAIPAALFLALCYHLRITPFGDKTFLYEDMKQQYIDFFSYYRAVFHGGDGFSYSSNCGLGSNMLGFWAYYLSSPFLLVFAVIPDKFHVVAVTYLIMVKISAISFTTFLFLNGRRENKHGYRDLNVSLICCVAFAYSGFVIANMTNIMWIDALIVMPVMALFLCRMVHHEKKSSLYYMLSVMALVYVNYYIAAMILFFAGVFMVLLLIFGELKLKRFFEYLLCTLAGIVMDSWLLVPTVISLLGTNKDHSGISAQAFKNILPKAEATGRYLGINEVIVKLFAMNYDSYEIMWGTPNIYFGVMLIIPVLLFFMNREIAKRKKFIAGSYLLIILMFFCIKPLNTLAHGGTDAYGYLYRYSFVFSFAAIAIAHEYFLHMEKTGFGALIFSLIFALGLAGVNVIFKPRFYYSRGTLFNTMLIVISFALCFAMMGARQNDTVFFSKLSSVHALFGMFLALELSMNFIRIYDCSSYNAETVSGYLGKIAEIESGLQQVQELEDIQQEEAGDYRIESLMERSPNDSLHFGYRSTTAYNSLLKVEERILMYRLGFNDNGLYTLYDSGNTRTADAILGVKYLLVEDDYKEEEGQVRASENVVENEYVVPADEITGENARDIISGLMEKENPFEAQTYIIERITGKCGEIFSRALVADDGRKTDDGTRIFEITAGSDGEMYFYMDRDKLEERSFEIFVDDNFVSYYGNASCQKVIDLGPHLRGDKVLLQIKIDDTGELPAEPVVVTENLEILGDVVDGSK